MECVKKLIVAVFICFFCVNMAGAGNYSGAVIHLKNGEKIECEVFTPSLYRKNVEYRLSQNSDFKKIPSEEISSVVMPDEEGNVSIVDRVDFVEWRKYLKGDNSKPEHTRLMSVVEYGPISLFCHSINTYSGTTGDLMKTYRFYVCRDADSDLGVEIGEVVSTRKLIVNKYKIDTKGDFYKVYEKLFSACPDLCKQIREKKLKFENIEDIVHEYNIFMTEKKK